MKELTENFNYFSKKTSIPEFLMERVHRFIESNFRDNKFNYIEPKELLNELPNFLKNEIILFSCYQIIQEIKLFKQDLLQVLNRNEIEVTDKMELVDDFIL